MRASASGPLLAANKYNLSLLDAKFDAERTKLFKSFVWSAGAKKRKLEKTNNFCAQKFSERENLS
jgi:hypothetical protein